MSKITLTAELRKELSVLYKGLRVADVRDGMDWMMMHHYGSMAHNIRPLWRTLAMGFARTARYVKYQGPVPNMTPDEYSEWVGWYYGNVCTYPWEKDIVEGDFIVLDCNGVDAGLIGSNNGLGMVLRGAAGLVTNGGIRDTDECIMQKLPFWCAMISQGMDQGRIQFDSKDIMVTVGDVQVNPGDVVIADGDGVVVVPLEKAKDVAKYARRENAGDRMGRGKLYESAGWNKDESVD
jgi:regulator of RNase E activity RraA